jgi:ATP-dependent Clp protease ATP-binding subunit ClpC
VIEGAGRISVAGAVPGAGVFERFTHMARRVVFFARFEATECHSPSLTADHLLLGLLRENRAIAVQILQGGEDAAAIRGKIMQRQSGSKVTLESDDMPLGKDAKRVLKFAIREAKSASRRHVGTGDVLLGLLRVEDTFAGELLRARGFELAALREEFAQTDPAENEGID